MGLSDTLISACCQYKSIRYIRVHNKKLATIYYALMTLVLIYVIIYTIIYEKGYQDTDDVTGTTSAKLKGSACTGNLNNYTDITELLPLDSFDLKQPSNEEDAFFVLSSFSFLLPYFCIVCFYYQQCRTTARTITRNQTRTFCNGNKKVPTCTHEDTSACQQGLFSPDSQGLFTGSCGDNGRCQMVLCILP